MAAERQRQRAADHDEQIQHASIGASVGKKINVDEFWRGSRDSQLTGAARLGLFGMAVSTIHGVVERDRSVQVHRRFPLHLRKCRSIIAADSESG
jgi:hypothetical protein